MVDEPRVTGTALLLQQRDVFLVVRSEPGHRIRLLDSRGNVGARFIDPRRSVAWDVLGVAAGAGEVDCDKD